MVDKITSIENVKNKVGIPEAATAPRPTPWSWVKGWPWTCPRCLNTIFTASAGPVCPRCHYRESAT